MGYNSVIFLCNDGQGAVDEDPEGWWWKCRSAFHYLVGGKPQAFGHMGYANAWQAVWNEHADVTGVIFVGQNGASILGCTGGRKYHDTEEQQIAILKDILYQKGYNVVKLPKAVK